MAFKVTLFYSDGTTEELDEVFSTRSDAEEAGSYNCSCYHEGAEILNMSNPGDYPLDEDDDVYYEVDEI